MHRQLPKELTPIRTLTILIVALTLTSAAQAKAPPTSYPLTRDAAKFRENTYRTHPCLARIIDRENGWWDQTVNYGGGHGNVYLSYGLPQANPGTKMVSAGPDWRTSRRTQLRWMIGYTRGRYGSECAALAHWLKHRSY